MRKLAFKVWSADDSEENARFVQGYDAEDVVEREGERRWSSGDYPAEQTFCVRDLMGVLTKWTVVAEQAVNFTAKLVKETG